MAEAAFPIGEKIADRYELKSLVKATNGEASVYVCDYDSWACLAKVYDEGKEPSDDKVEAIKSINSPYLIKKMDRVKHNERYCEIMPYFEKSDLISSGAPLNDKKMLGTIIPNVMEALKEIHDKGYIHGNVRPTNIFYSQFSFDVQLGDFGVDFANIGNLEKFIDFGFVTPEMLTGEYTQKADWWSLGITLYNLVKGKDCFAGLNKKHALKQAATIELEIPDKVSPQLRSIILGLTVKDPATRWGYDELKKALAGEEVPIVDEYVYEPPNRNYTFKGTVYSELTDVAAAFSDDWNEALKCVNDSTLKAIVSEYAEDKLEEVSACMTMSFVNSHMALHRLIKILNPDIPLCWMGLKFKDAQDFVSQMAENEDKQIFAAAIASKLISSVAESTGVDENKVSRIKAIEDDARFGADFDMVAYKLEYILSGDYVYTFRGTSCKDVKAFVNYIKSNVKDLDAICDEFINDKKFFAWLEILGYGEQIEEWKKTIA